MDRLFFPCVVLLATCGLSVVGLGSSGNDSASSDKDWLVKAGNSEGSTILKYQGADSRVVVPSHLGGKTVTCIAERAFSGCIGLTNVVIPDGVRDLGDFAFFKCSQLAAVTIPKSVTNIGASAFSGCTGLTKLSIPDSVVSIEDGAFSRCDGLQEVEVPVRIKKKRTCSISGLQGSLHDAFWVSG